MKIFCIGRNYADHAKEMNSPVPTTPMIFMKPSTALLPYGKPFFIPDFSDDVHYELELVVRISKQGKSISESNALDHVGDVSLGIDFTARDLQRQCKENGHPWEIAKSFDYSAAIGEWHYIPVEDLGDLEFRLELNGEVVQHGLTKHMIFTVPQLIAYLSHRFTLQKGDLIYTGTPAGVGPVQSGDLLEGYLGDKLTLVNKVK